MARYRNPANPERAKAEAERARSGAAGIHQDRRSRRARTRAANKLRARRDDTT